MYIAFIHRIFLLQRRCSAAVQFIVNVEEVDPMRRLRGGSGQHRLEQDRLGPITHPESHFRANQYARLDDNVRQYNHPEISLVHEQRSSWLDRAAHTNSPLTLSNDRLHAAHYRSRGN